MMLSPAEWSTLADRAASAFGTPLYVFAWRPVADAIASLESLRLTLPVRHWLSVKTHPLPPLLRSWRILGKGVEVVSEYELHAAVCEGFEPHMILVNGVGKYDWLARCDLRGLRVHIDSVLEANRLAARALTHGWCVGLRLRVPDECDPDEPGFGAQFGMTVDEAHEATRVLRAAGVEPEGVHFHIGSNVVEPDAYARSIRYVSAASASIGLRPKYVDCGGGFPVPGERLASQGGLPTTVDLARLSMALGCVRSSFPEAREVWLENGRYVTARSGVLIVRVLDVKERLDSRYLICDGGRTNHALVSDWEVHDLSPLHPQPGPLALTTVCGPTCMPFDRLARVPLPIEIGPGDYLMWSNAGAYHISWETRFSHGLAAVAWYDHTESLSLVRHRETPAAWWSVWN